jgi:cell division septation protein DedD
MPSYVPQRRGEEQESFFCRFTFGQFFALLVLEVFTLFFVFYLGARYGRGLLGLDRPPAVALEGTEVVEGASARVMTTADPEVAKMAEELAAGAETPELKDRIQQMIKNAQGERMPEVVAVERKVEERAVAPEPSEPEALLEETRPQPKRGADEARQAASDASVIRVKSAQNARYSVQVGSYPDMAEGTRVVEKWKAKGYPAYLMIADIPDRGRWYRVRIGGFESREEATRYLDEFASRENVEALVVLNEQ